MVALNAVLALLASSSLAMAVPLSELQANEHEEFSKRVDYGVPTSWRQFGTSLVFAQRNTIALNAMNEMIALGGSHQAVGNLGYWQSANVWSALVLKDLYAKTQDYSGKSLDAVGDTFGQYPNFRQNGYNDDTLWWASAAIYQYEAYGNTVALGWAQNSWSDVSRYQLGSATSGQGKSFSWKSTCAGQSTQGGVFWNTDAGDDSVNAITTGLFMTLSARLYAATKNTQYLNAAVTAYNFIMRQLYNTSTSLVNDTLHVTSCSTQAWVFTYNSGKFVEGLAVLGAATGNAAYTNQAIATAVAGMRNGPWQGSDGIITEGASGTHNQNNDGWGFKAVWIRGLAELFRRQPNNSGLLTLIHSYVDTQANALMQLASNTGNTNANQYSANWEGPYDGMYAWTQLAALDVFGTFVMVNSP